MQTPEDNKDGAEVAQAILAILLRSFPLRVDLYDTDIADIIGLNYETSTQKDGATEIAFDSLPSGAALEDMTNGVLSWLSLEGLTHHADSTWSEVILSAKGLKALDLYPSYMPAV